MKDYLHRQFMKFYYNGIFMQQLKAKNEEGQNTKVVKSNRFNSLLSKFNSTSNTNAKISRPSKSKSSITNENNNINNNSINSINLFPILYFLFGFSNLEIAFLNSL